MPEKFTGDKGPTHLESWLFQMHLYMQATGVPPEQQAIIAATNLGGHAALWFQSEAAGHDLSGVTFDALAQAMRDAFLPQDVAQRYMTAFLAVK